MYSTQDAVLRPLAGLLLGLGLTASASWGADSAAAPPTALAPGAAHSSAGSALTEPGPLTETVALRLALGEAAFNALLDARIDAAAGEVLAASLRPNPEFELERESARGFSDPSETTFRLAQTLDTSGRRALRRQSAAARLEAAHLETDAERLERAVRVRRQFFTTLQGQRRVEVLDAWSARVGDAQAIVRQRVQAGEASGYDLTRLDQERALALADQAAAEASLVQEREALWALLGGGRSPATPFAGDLRPDPPPPIEQLIPRVEGRPDLLALLRQEEAALLDGRAGERGRLPDLRLGVGSKYIREGNRDDWGIVVGVAVPLPLFDRGQADVATAQAAAHLAASEYRLALVEAQAGLRGLWERASRLERVAQGLQDETVPVARALAETARISYRAGELGILELVDAYRSLMDAELRALELALEARLARVELDRLAGRAGP